MVDAEVKVKRRGQAKPPKAVRRWSPLPFLREVARQLLPEPAPVRAYCPPSEYVVENGKVYYSDGMTKDYKPNLFTKVFAAITLGLYIGIPYIILALSVASIWSLWARMLLAAIVGSAFMPLRPLFSKAVMNSYVFLTWRRYFKFSYLFDQSLDAYSDYVTSQFPHGAFPLGSLICGTFMATEYPEYTCYALAANNSFLVPVWRHVHTWMGAMAATERNFRRLLALGTCRGIRASQAAAARDAAVAAGGKPEDAPADSDSPGSSEDGTPGGTPRAGEAPMGGAAGAATAPPRRTRLRKRNAQGVSVSVMVGGIAEMYLQHPDFERIKLLDRKGFVRIAIEHGADILPVYMFGASRLMNFGPSWLMNFARKLRMSIGVLYGAWGTPIPHRVPLRMAVGVPVPVGPAMHRGDPRFEAQVEAVHAAVVEAIKKVYYRHRVDYGWGDRELVIV